MPETHSIKAESITDAYAKVVKFKVVKFLGKFEIDVYIEKGM
jgi:hypothetical protein